MTLIFNSVVDRVLRLNRGDRVEWLTCVEEGIERFPEIAGLDRIALLRQIVVRDVFNRVAFRLETKLPGMAIFVARFVKITGAVDSFARTPSDRPIILSLTHFGPVHFVFTALRPLLGNRKVYVMHAGGDTSAAVARYMRRLGAIPIVNDERALRKLAAAIADDPYCAIVYAFDYMGARGRRPITFLGVPVAVGRSVAFLADTSKAVVLTAVGKFALFKVSVDIGGPFEVDVALDRNARQDRLTRDLFALVEARIRVAPAEWTEWFNCIRSEGDADRRAGDSDAAERLPA